MSTFGSRLKKTRKSRNITQNNLAKSLKVGQSTIANYENNVRFPGSQVLKDISEQLDVSTDYLLGLETLTEDPKGSSFFEFENLYIHLVDILLEGDIKKAKKIVKDIDLNVIKTTKIIEELFIPLLELVGDRWARDELSIAEQSYITEVIEKLLDFISVSNEVKINTDLRVLFMALPGEEHIISLKMSTEYFKVRGWDMRFIGRNIPIESLVELIEKNNIDLLVLSSMTSISLNSLSYTVSALQAKLMEKTPLILFGGAQVTSFNEKLISRFSDYAVKTLEELPLVIKAIENRLLNNQ